VKKKKRIKAAMKNVRCGACLETGCPKPLKCAKKFQLDRLVSEKKG
jgi:hypothetical protein